MTQKPRKREEGNFLAGMGVGVLIGLAVSLGIAFYLNRTPIPFTTAKPKQAEKNGATAKPPAIAGLPQSRPRRSPQRRSPSSTSTASCPAPRNRSRKRRFANTRAKGGQQESAKDVYFIQAGSFQNPAEADNQKARLAILGFESSVEPANLPDKGTWYRVRMGPYAKLDEINKVRQALAQNGIDASLIKVKDQQ